MLGLNYARDYIIRGGGPWGLRVMQWELIIPISRRGEVLLEARGKTWLAENRPVNHLREEPGRKGKKVLRGALL